jgi:septum formation protein
MNQDFVYLASGSPRRRELLQQIGVPFRVVGAAVDEAVLPGEDCAMYVARLAAAKAERGWVWSCGAGLGEGSPDAAVPVLAADTAVVLDARIFGKPRDKSQALDMLRQLSGRTHEVLTAVALRTAAGTLSSISRSEVTFRAISEGEAQAYWETGEPRDKAGAYAIQGRAAIFVAALRGSFSGVMGLPLFETAELLRAAQVPYWQGREPK